MQNSLHKTVLGLALVVIGVSAFAGKCHRATIDKRGSNARPEFPFMEIIGAGDNTIYVHLTPEHYSRTSLEALCLWYYRKSQREPYGFRMLVFTDKERMDRYINDQLYPYKTAPKNAEVQKEMIQPPRLFQEDASCNSALSDSHQQKNAGASSYAFNLWCRYSPDLDVPNIKKTMVVRGSTWTEGKYNIQEEEVGHIGNRILISAYDLYNTEPSGRFYTFQHQIEQGGVLRRRNIFHLRQDILAPPPINQARYLSDQILYVYMGWLYSITIDGGEIWHLWDAEKELQGWKCCDPGLIQNVTVASDGSGIMKLRLNPEEPQKILELYTKDYGQHWAER